MPPSQFQPINMEYPWNHLDLVKWDLVGMNHHYVNKVRHLFVAMSRGSILIKAEGHNERDVFHELVMQASRAEINFGRIK